ncbi:hypothetical protein QJS10_CPA09g00286 [Acorus calamus]|uniref:Uncharacterized protein n=1 Tax=Acorus calamus TaxID=4465 RepID=A0AAV9E499_ACOCL|nr:hypothetical protein QJS10_CPA09g00286 [Acorus calamus]
MSYCRLQVLHRLIPRFTSETPLWTPCDDGESSSETERLRPLKGRCYACALNVKSELLEFKRLLDESVRGCKV